MTDLGAVQEDVRFDFDAAAALSARLRATAQVLCDQVGWRQSLAGVARAEWRGRFAEQFDVRVGIGSGDAHRLAESMVETATRLDRVAQRAWDEQQRRLRAREWIAEQQAANPVEAALDWAHDLVFGDDVPPDIVPPIEPEAVTAPETLVRADRG